MQPIHGNGEWEKESQEDEENTTDILGHPALGPNEQEGPHGQPHTAENDPPEPADLFLEFIIVQLGRVEIEKAHEVFLFEIQKRGYLPISQGVQGRSAKYQSTAGKAGP